MSCGSWCVYYKDKGKTSACTECQDYEHPKPRLDMSDKVDIFKLARLLRQKEEKKKEEERKAKIPQLTSCLQCYEPSLFYDSIHDQFECLNLKCKIYSSPILFNTEEYNSVIAILS